MDLGLTGRTALVTGASKGIGFASAWSLAREGCNVHLASRTAADLEKAQAGDMVAFLASDLSANTTGTIITIDGGASARVAAS